jgi:hypothetical protein
MIAAEEIPGLRRTDAETQSLAFNSPRLCASAVKILLIVGMLWSPLTFGQQPPQPALSDQFAPRRAEAEAAREGHRAKLFVELAHAEMEAADKAFTEGNVELGQKLVASAGSDADQAGKAAVDSGKRLKDTEIDLRKLQVRTRDIGRSLAFEDRPPLEKIVQRIEAMREAILERMFSGKKKGKP